MLPYNLLQLFHWALKPAEDEILSRLFKLGYLNSSVYAESSLAREIVQDDFPLAENRVTKQRTMGIMQDKRETA